MVHIWGEGLGVAQGEWLGVAQGEGLGRLFVGWALQSERSKIHNNIVVSHTHTQSLPHLCNIFKPVAEVCCTRGW